MRVGSGEEEKRVVKTSPKMGGGGRVASARRMAAQASAVGAWKRRRLLQDPVGLEVWRAQGGRCPIAEERPSRT